MLRRVALSTLKRPRHISPISAAPIPYLPQQSRWYAQNKKSKGYSAGNPASPPQGRPSQFIQPSIHSRKPPESSQSQALGASSSLSSSADAPQSTQRDSGFKKSRESFSQQSEPYDPVVAADRQNTSPAGDHSSTTSPPKQEDWSPAQAGPDSDVSKDLGKSNGPSRPLPDLTQGIPSTLEEELRQADPRRSDPASLNVTEDPAAPAAGSAGRGGGRGDLPRDSYVSSSEQKRNQLARIFYAALFGGTILGAIWLGRNWETPEEEKQHSEAPSGWGFGLFYHRIGERLSGMLSYYNEPAFPELLPDPDPDPLQRYPFTLVLSLEDLLMHTEWTRDHGWRIAKRPGMDYFIRYLSQYYEIVLFTSQPSMTADPVIRKLDPYRVIRFPLFREATLYRGGEYIKVCKHESFAASQTDQRQDLSYLNRDLSKVLLVDTVPGHAKHQPENAIILPKWKGDPKDQTLIALLPFLEYVATMGFDDTREVLKSFEGTYIPEEFHRRETVLREKFLAEEKAKAGNKRSGRIGLVAAFSSRPRGDGMEDFGAQEGKMIWDQIRERGQKQYQMIDKEIRENGEKWLAEMAAEEKKYQEESMKGMMSGLNGWFGGGREAKKDK